MVYGELGAALPRSGGEYALLRRTLHPAAGFAAGVVSATVGFAAPTALAAAAMAAYLGPIFPGMPATHFAAAAIVMFTAIHAFPVGWGSGVNNVLTGAKIVLVAGFCGLGFLAPPISNPLVPQSGDFSLVLTPGFAVSLVFVSYAYTGWNAAAYIVGDLRRPERLARALVAGTLLVTVLYALVNLVILRAVPLPELAGRIEIGYLAAERILGSTGGRVMSGFLALVLSSTVSAMVFLGPRVIRAMGEDEAVLRKLGRTSAGGVPHRALLLQLAVTLTLLYSGTFEQILLYAGFTLSLMTAATVAGVFALRRGRVRGAIWGTLPGASLSAYASLLPRHERLGARLRAPRTPVRVTARSRDRGGGSAALLPHPPPYPEPEPRVGPSGSRGSPYLVEERAWTAKRPPRSARRSSPDTTVRARPRARSPRCCSRVNSTSR